jgi:hypothetical protein
LGHVDWKKFIDVSEVPATSNTRAMMEAASTSETLVNIYQTTWSNNPEDSHLHSHYCENLKSHRDSEGEEEEEQEVEPPLPACGEAVAEFEAAKQYMISYNMDKTMQELRGT